MTLTTDEIRERFLSFMEKKGHKRYPSDNIVPENDASLLFNVAGMVQFKPQFAGVDIKYPRVTNSQKCIRTTDIENVGKTSRHHTFFEMLGFFSFGDYFKEQAITQYWEFLMQEMKLDKKDLWITIYKDDDEAFDIWSNLVDKERIVRLDEDENFWPAGAPTHGPNGPCGPCTEIHFDRGEQFGADDPQPGGPSDRFLEIGNIVFTQFDRQDGGVLEPLPQKNIDFGGGLERLASVIQGVETNFEIDTFKSFQEKLVLRLKLKLPFTTDDQARINRIMDHLRAVVVCVADGVQPGPNSRGYVVRRLLRRAILDLHDLGVDRPVLESLIDDTLAMLGGGYPELKKAESSVKLVVKTEEENFRRTLSSGRNLLENHIETMKRDKLTQLHGDKAFDLYSTYGFPLELTEELLAEHQLTVDGEGYKKASEADRELSRSGSGMNDNLFDESPAKLAATLCKDTKFVGYDTTQHQSKITALVGQEGLVESLGLSETGFLFVDETPFYAESGGQLGDQGCLSVEGGQAQIVDTQKESGLYVHEIKVTEGKIDVGQTASLEVDALRRRRTEANHSATHLMNWALREVLGDSVNQAGSQVGPDALRFDFTHPRAVTPEEIQAIEDKVNDAIWQAAQSKTELMGIEKAKESGAVAMFGEKYGDEVRVLTIGPSKELCGGTHVSNTGEIGLFQIVGQEAVGSGIRRLIGKTQESALNRVRQRDNQLVESAKLLKVAPDEMIQKIQSLVDEQQVLKKKNQSLMQSQSAFKSQELLSDVKDLHGLKVLVRELDEGDDVMKIADSLKGKVDACFLAAPGPKGLNLLVSLGPNSLEKGFKAGELIKMVSAPVNGKGGGQPALARGSGSKKEGLKEAFTIFEESLKPS